MNFYPFHIGDYVSHTRHLSLLEDLAYRRLIDQYYLHEGPLPADIPRIAKMVGLRDHEVEVRAVLEEFFELTEEGWSSTRCDKELVTMRKRQEIAREKANKRWSNAAQQPQQPPGKAPAKKDDAAALPQECSGNATNTITNTKENKDKAPAALSAEELVADGLTAETAAEWIAHRKRVKAPLTPKAWSGIKAQAGKAGMPIEDAVLMSLRNGWRGFEAEWVRSRGQPQRQSSHSGFSNTNYSEGINDDGSFS